MIKKKGKHFAQRRLSRLDTWAAGVTSELGFHSSWVVWSKRFLVNRFPDRNCGGRILLPDFLEDVSAACSLFREGGL